MILKDIENSTILLVDDNLESVAALCEYLKFCDFTVSLSENGQEALKFAREHQPDIIVMDVLMPGLDGFETCRRLKEHDDTKHIPVIFVSAYTETIDKVKGFESGGVDYIAKPFQHQEVVARIGAHLRLRNLQKSLQEKNIRLEEEIEHRIKTEQALRESQEEFRTIFENAPVMIKSYDGDRKFQLWNSECEKCLGYTQEEINAAEDPFLLLYPDPDVRAQVLPAMSEVDGVFREYNVTRKDGATRVQLWAYFSLPSGVTISVGHDITERKQSEQALRESQQYSRNIIESSLDMIITVDTDRRIVEFNPAAEEAFGYIHEEVIGQNVSILYARSEESSSVGEIMVRESQSVKEVYNRRKNGEEFPCLLAASTLRDAEGKTIGYMGISRDITDLKQAQKQLEEQNVQLQELNASKDKFFSIISHDLKNQFGTLLGFGELVIENYEGYTAEKIKSLVGKMFGSAQKLYALLENLLTWSRIQRGVMKCQPAAIDMYPIAFENVELFTSQAERKQVHLKNTVTKGAVIYADYSMIDTVVRNLLSNALKFTSAGGSITVSAVDHDERYRSISIADTGVGIPEKVLPKLLRIDAHHTTAGTAGEKGTGLGLILCKDLVEKNGGSMWIESEVGKGTTFTFTLPKEPVEAST
jgi:PAS domain S-box-containing protein